MEMKTETGTEKKIGKDRDKPDPKTEADWSAKTAVTGTGEPRISANKFVVVFFVRLYLANIGNSDSSTNQDDKPRQQIFLYA